MLYSSNGSTWTSITTNFTTCFSIAWNGTIYIAGGTGTDQLTYSYNGINWYSSDTNIFSTTYGIATNQVGPFLQDSQFILDINGIEQTNQLDITSNYYSYDYSNMNLSIKTDSLL